jgi:hypothetical protein
MHKEEDAPFVYVVLELATLLLTTITSLVGSVAYSVGDATTAFSSSLKKTLQS